MRHTQSENVQNKRAYKVEEIAEILGISKGLAYRFLKKGYFKTVNIDASIRILKNPLMSGWINKIHKYKRRYIVLNQ